MKFCEKAVNSLYVGFNGDCYLCSWMNKSVGNLGEQSFDEIFYGEKATRIREAMAKGDFGSCNHRSCKFLENNSLADFTADEVSEKMQNVNIEFIDIAHDQICNLSCPSCRNEVFVPDESYKKLMVDLNDKLQEVVNRDTINKIQLSGSGDIFASKYAMDFAKKMKPLNTECQIIIQTNGVLFNEKTWSEIEHLANYNLIVSITPNSYNRLNYTYINGGHNTLDRLLDNLKFIKALREANKINKLLLAMVVQERNFMDIPDFIDRSINEFGADEVILRPIYKWFLITEENYWYKDILNPLHPYHKQYMAILNSPEVCENPKVYLWGAKNLHKKAKHPAYKYQDYLNEASKLFMNQDWFEKLKALMKEKGAEDIIIYGENELSNILYNSLNKNSIPVRFILGRDLGCCDCCDGIEKCKIADYKSRENDFVVISNFDVRDKIERDLYFNKFNGYLCDIRELNERFKA